MSRSAGGRSEGVVVLHETIGVGRDVAPAACNQFFPRVLMQLRAAPIKRALVEPNPKFQAAHEAIMDHMGHGNSMWSFGIREEDGRCYITTLNTEEEAGKQKSMHEEAGT